MGLGGKDDGKGGERESDGEGGGGWEGRGRLG